MNDSAELKQDSPCSYLNHLMPQAQLAHRPSICIYCITMYICGAEVASACCVSVEILTEWGWRKAKTVVCPFRGKQNH